MAQKLAQAVVYVNSNNEAVVFPPVILLAKNDEVDIVNATGDEILIIYPADLFKDDGGSGIDPNKTNKVVTDKGKHTRKVHGSTTKQGRVPFKIFSFKTGTLAKGNSDPEFIIE